MSSNDVHAESMQNLQISFSDGVTAEQRAVAERSVAAHIAHVTEARAPERAARTALAEATAAMNAPLMRLIEADPDAAKALADARDRRQELRRLLDVDLPTVPRIRDLHLDPIAFADNGVADQLFPIPYHYTWQWHRGASGNSSADRDTGNVTVGTTVDDVEFSDVHAGVGVFMSATAPRPVVARSLRSSSESYLVYAGGFGGDAVVEGGTEMTLVEDNTLKSSAVDKRFRKRVSNGESDQQDTGGFGLGDGSIEVAVLMVPGRAYTLNVGAWVYCEQHGGFGLGGDSGAVARVAGKVIFMSLFDQ